MKREYMKLISFTTAIVLLLSGSTVSAAAEVYEEYTLEAAIQTGLENSILLQQLEDKITLSDLKYRAYKDMTSDLNEGQDTLGSGEDDIETALDTIDASQELLNNAKIDMLNGYYPAGFPDYTVITETQLPDGYTLPELVISSESGSEDRRTVLKQFYDYWDAHETELATYVPTFDPDANAEALMKQVKLTVREQQKALDNGKIDYEEELLTLVDGKIDYAIAKANISSSLAENLNMSELSKLSVSDDRKLLLKISKALATVTFASRGIYRNQIALQIQNCYYDALKAKKLMEVKKSSMERAETQYRFAKDGYETGMKVKDGMLLADLYLTGTKLEYQKAQSDYENALVELKKNINIPLDKNITLEEAGVNDSIAMELEEGIDLGLTDRLEIINAQEQVDIYDVNLSVVKKRYNSKTTQYKEALRLKNLAILELEKAENDVESSVRQSHNTMAAMASLLETSEYMVDQAKECLEIAQARYEVGFGADSALLTSLGLNSSSGTVLEVISAEENLEQVEEKYIEILYGYNLAKAKYLNDIAYLTY